MNIPQTLFCNQTVEFQCSSDVLAIEFIAPSGSSQYVQPFSYQPIKLSYEEDGIENVFPDGNLIQLARYTPVEEGMHEVYLCREGTRTFFGQIQVLKSDLHGFIGVSKKDSRYFAYSDGTPFVPVGINLAYPTAYGSSSGTEFGRENTLRYCGLKQYERWMKALSENGCNLIRIWAGCDYFCPDTKTAGVYKYEKFSLLDRLFELAEQYNLKVKLTLEQFRYFDYREKLPEDAYTADIYRKFSKQLYADGERCESMTDFLSEDKWKKYWLMKVREYAARYAAYPHLFAIEFWNEMNAVQVENKELLYQWNREMAVEVQKMFPNTMVINSLGSFDVDYSESSYSIFPFDAFAFKQVHRYLDLGARLEICKGHPVVLSADAINVLKEDNCPILLAETGAVESCHSGPFKYYSSDHRGILFADTVYPPLFAGAAGSGNIWHWNERYVENKNLYSLFKPLAQLIDGIAFDEQHFTSQMQETETAYILLLKGKDYTLGYVRNKQDTWQHTLRDGNSVTPIDITIPVNGKLEVYPLWEPFDYIQKDNSVTFCGMRYGALFKVRNESF